MSCSVQVCTRSARVCLLVPAVQTRLPRSLVSGADDRSPSLCLGHLASGFASGPACVRVPQTACLVRSAWDLDCLWFPSSHTALRTRTEQCFVLAVQFGQGKVEFLSFPLFLRRTSRPVVSVPSSQLSFSPAAGTLNQYVNSAPWRSPFRLVTWSSLFCATFLKQDVM